MARGRLVPLVLVAADRGQFAIETFEAAVADDGEIRGLEVRRVRDAIVDWFTATKAAKAGKRLANAAECGVGMTGDRTYFNGLVDQYGHAMDEFPDEVA